MWFYKTPDLEKLKTPRKKDKHRILTYTYQMGADRVVLINEHKGVTLFDP